MKRIQIIADKKRDLKRAASKDLDILDWLDIWEGSREYFDGSRDHGYGGYYYDGRWKQVVEKLIQTYDLGKESSLVDIGCAKGFLVNDFNMNPKVGHASGVDISLYALLRGKRDGMKGRFLCSNSSNLPFENNSFDLAFCKDTLHNILDKKDVIRSLKEIGRISRHSWVRVGAYNNQNQKWILDKWATFATSYFHVSEWHEIFHAAGYTGDYDWFHPSDEIIDEV